MSRVVAITGATGFVGRYLTRALQEAGWTVKALSRTTTDYSRDSLIKALNHVDFVIHLAGRRMTREDAPNDLTPFIDPNVLLAGRLMDAATACGVTRLVFASTIAVYDPMGAAPYQEEDTPPCPINAYALSKVMAEDYLSLLERSGGPSVISLRLAAIYGNGEKGTPALMRFINQACASETLTLSGNANYGIDQLYVRDAVSALIAAMTPSAPSGVYNIGAGQVYGIKTLAQTVNIVFDNVDNLDASAATDGPQSTAYMTITKAHTGLGWQPRFDLVTGLTDLRRTKDAD